MISLIGKVQKVNLILNNKLGDTDFTHCKPLNIGKQLMTAALSLRHIKYLSLEIK